MKRALFCVWMVLGFRLVYGMGGDGLAADDGGGHGGRALFHRGGGRTLFPALGMKGSRETMWATIWENDVIFADGNCEWITSTVLPAAVNG